MQLDFTADQEELRSSIRSVLTKECPISVVRAHVEAVVGGESSDLGGRLWETFTGLDWQALTIAEEHGGIGLGYPELAVLAEELGRVVAPSPLLATVAGFVPLLREAEGGEAWLEKIAAGQLSGATAFDPAHVLCGGEVDEIAVVRDGTVTIAPATAMQVHHIRSLDATRTLVRIDLDTLPAGVGHHLPITGDGVRRALEEMTVALAFEIVGFVK